MKRARKAVCVLVSGGVESAAMISLMLRRGQRVYPVYVREGHAWEKVELYWLPKLLRWLKAPALSVLELPMQDCYPPSHWSLTGRRVPSARTRDAAVYLPGRNILLLAKASVFCAQRGVERIALGTLGSNPFPDAGARFFKEMSRALSSGLDAPLRVERPFARLHKDGVLHRFPALPWELTFSCIAPKGRLHCGRCNKCAERKAAFRRAGLPDPTRYG